MRSIIGQNKFIIYLDKVRAWGGARTLRCAKFWNLIG